MTTTKTKEGSDIGFPPRLIRLLAFKKIHLTPKASNLVNKEKAGNTPINHETTLPKIIAIKA